jgi:hypothetical protein
MSVAKRLQERMLAACGDAALVGAVLVALLMLYTPFWETNDDVGMSMVAHGYGIAAYPSSALIFSNVCWGWLLSHLPVIGGILPYSYMTFVITFLAGWLIFSCLTTIGVPWLPALLVIAAISTRMVASPQFTILSGFATIAGIAAWGVHHRDTRQIWLILGAMFLLLGYLIRPLEFVFVLLMALPLVMWNKVVRDVRIWTAAGAVLLLIAAAKFIDWHYYQASEWVNFSALNIARRPFTDWLVGPLLQAHPELLRLHNYSLNDVSLISSWFFVDPHIADPVRLKALAGSIDWSSRLSANLTKGLDGVLAVTDPVIAPLFLAAAVVGLLSPHRKKIFLAIGVFLSCLFLLGALWRPSVLRVYYPICALLLIAAVMHLRTDTVPLANKPDLKLLVRRNWRIVFVLVILFSVFAAGVRRDYLGNQQQMEDSHPIQTELRQLDPQELYVVWLGYLRRELAFPVFNRDEKIRALDLYMLGSFTMAPFEKAQWDARPWQGLGDRLLHGSPVPFLSEANSTVDLSLLREYCREHHARKLSSRTVPVEKALQISYVTCIEPE